ncbi:MAG: hypothetical protein RSH79_06850 [Clostridiales bacterium]
MLNLLIIFLGSTSTGIKIIGSKNIGSKNIGSKNIGFKIIGFKIIDTTAIGSKNIFPVYSSLITQKPYALLLVSLSIIKINKKA